MATKDITDRQVLEAYVEATARRKTRLVGGTSPFPVYPDEILAVATGQCEKVCYRACERAYRRGLLEYGTWLRVARLTPEGQALLDASPVARPPATPLRAGDRCEIVSRGAVAMFNAELLKYIGRTFFYVKRTKAGMDQIALASDPHVKFSVPPRAIVRRIQT